MSYLKLKCTKFDFGWGFVPDPAGGAYSAPPDPLAGFKGLTSKGKVGEVRGKGGGVSERDDRKREEGKGGGRKGGRERLAPVQPPPVSNS